MRAFFEHSASGLNGIFDSVKAGDGAGAESGGVHDDGVALDHAIEIEVRTVARVEDGIVLENRDGGFDGVQGMAAVREDSPTGAKSAKAAGFAGVNGFVRDVPGTTVKNERRAHEEKGYQISAVEPALAS